MREQDKQNRFLIESCDVNGQIVQLDQCWKDARARTDYPPTIQTVLGEAFVATVLLAAMLKMDGKCTLQVRGPGPVHLLVVQVNSAGECRGLARWKDEPTASDVKTVFGEDANMTIAIESSDYAEPYQGIVPLEGDTLADAIGFYLSNSQQLRTQLIMSVNADTASGLLLQKLPSSEARTEDEDGWSRAKQFAATVTDQELTELGAEELLRRTFFEEEVRVFDATDVSFKCACSRERTGNMLIGLGEAEMNDILAERDEVVITCEFCNAQYQYDSVDIAALFKGAADEIDGSQQIH
ncbi:MAG: Hsp33 family molecular chaperone HslO [Granulosicoccaceae bacterium]